jgi:ribosome-binding factor A
MDSKRQRRVAEQIHETLSELLQFEVHDPRLTDVTVMEVRVDRELMYATVYVAAMGGDEERDEVLDGLGSAAGFLRRELSRRVRLQHTPELRFEWDETLARAEHIDDLLDSLDIPPEDEPDADDQEYNRD